MLKNLISDLEKYLNIDIEKKEKEHNRQLIDYIISLTDGNIVSITEIDNHIFMSANICHFSEKEIEKPEDFYIHLMKANYLGTSTGNGIISISPDNKFITLSLLIDYEINYKIFRDLLERLYKLFIFLGK